jgi:hypothetical protein
MKTTKAKVLRVLPGEYTKVVLDTPDGLNIVTILPNWNLSVKPNEEYYITLTDTTAGVSTYYCNNSEEFKVHKYTSTYLTEAISVKEEIQNKIKLNHALEDTSKYEYIYNEND